MWNVFKKVWVKAKGVKAVLSDACNIGYADGGEVTNGERILFPQRFPGRSSTQIIKKISLSIIYFISH